MIMTNVKLIKVQKEFKPEDGAQVIKYWQVYVLTSGGEKIPVKSVYKEDKKVLQAYAEVVDGGDQ